MKKRYRFFHIPALAWFSGDLYHDVGRRWGGIGGLYLLLIVALTWVPTLIRLQTRMQRFCDKQGAEVARQVPPIVIDSGKVEVQAQQPYEIWATDDDGQRRLLAVLDTTGKVKSLDDTDAVMLLTRNRLLARKSAGRVETYDLRSIPHLEIDSKRCQGWVAWARNSLPVIMWPTAIIAGFLLRLLQMVLYALIGLIIASAAKVRLSFGALMRLSVVAVTPVLLLNVLLEFLSVQGCWWTVTGIIVALAYLGFGIYSCRQDGGAFAPILMPAPPGAPPQAPPANTGSSDTDWPQMPGPPPMSPPPPADTPQG